MHKVTAALVKNSFFGMKTHLISEDKSFLKISFVLCMINAVNSV